MFAVEGGTVRTCRMEGWRAESKGRENAKVELRMVRIKGRNQ